VAGFRLNTRLKGSKVARKRFAQAVQNTRKRQWLVVRRAALFTEKELKKGIRSGAPGGKKFKPLAPSTRILRKGRKPLIDTGSLLRSIKTTLIKARLSAFVGVHRTTAGGAFNVALVHEFGSAPFVIPVTPAVRRLFWYLHFVSNGKILPLSPSKTQIMHPGVPARPFVRPTIQKIQPQLHGVMLKTFAERGGPI